MEEKRICENCKYWRASPILVDPKKVISSQDPAINAILKQFNDHHEKSGICTRGTPFSTVIEYNQWRAVQNDYICIKFEKKIN